MVADPVALPVCAGHGGEALTAKPLMRATRQCQRWVVVLVGDVPTALMIARVARAASALSVSPAVIVPSAGTTTTSTVGRSLRCIITGTVRPAPMVPVRPVPVTSTRIGEIEGPGRGAGPAPWRRCR